MIDSNCRYAALIERYKQVTLIFLYLTGCLSAESF